MRGSSGVSGFTCCDDGCDVTLKKKERREWEAEREGGGREGGKQGERE